MMYVLLDVADPGVPAIIAVRAGVDGDVVAPNVVKDVLLDEALPAAPACAGEFETREGPPKSDCTAVVGVDW